MADKSKRNALPAEQPPNMSKRATVTKGIKIDEVITIQKKPAELYRFWRDFENLPKFMTQVKAITVSKKSRSHWIIRTMMRTIEWDAEIITEKTNEMISWRTLPGSLVQHAGSVWFHPAGGNRGTEVRVQMLYHVPGGKLTYFLSALIGESPNHILKDDLRRLRSFMEAGEIPTVKGQTHGKRTGQVPARPDGRSKLSKRIARGGFSLVKEALT